MKVSKHVVAMLASSIFAVAGESAHAMLAVDQAGLNPLTPGALGGALDGLGRMTFTYTDGSFAGHCSANLLAGGRYAVTAGHCVSNSWNAQLDFMGGTVSRGVANVYVPSTSWTFFGSDIAILQLDAPVTSIQGFGLATNNVLGQSVLMAGFGWSGTGDSGATQPWGAGYYGYNRYDVRLTERNSEPLYGAIYGFDFDNGLINQDTNCFLFSVCDLGVGDQEASISLGDSGGGSFVWDGSHWLLAGIHSHASERLRTPCSFDANQICGDINDSIAPFWGIPYDSSFGEVFWDTSVQPHLSWIQSIISSGQQVPEPSVLATFALGLLIATSQTRRRGKVLPSSVPPVD